MAESGFSAGSIFVAFRATVDDFQKGLKSAIDGLKSFGSQVGGIASKVASFGSAVARAFTAPLRAVGSFVSSLATLKTLVVGLIAGKVFDELVTGPARAAVELERMAARAGIAASQLEKLQFIVSAAGGHGEDISLGIEKLNKILDDTRRGATEFLPVLKELGVEGLSTAQILNRIVANPQLAAAGLKKLGISEFAVLAKLSREEIDKLQESFVRLGNGTDAKLSALGNRLQVVKTQLKQAFSNIADSVSTLILPPLLRGLEFAEKFIERHFPEILAFFDTVGQEVGNLFDAIKRTAQTPGKMIEALQATVETAFKAIGDVVIEGFNGLVGVGIAGFKALGAAVIVLTGPFFEALWQSASLWISQILERAKSVIELWLRDLLISLLNMAKTTVGAVIPGLSAAIDAALVDIGARQIAAFEGALKLAEKQRAEFEALAKDLQGTNEALTKAQLDTFRTQAGEVVKLSATAIQKIAKTLTDAAGQVLGAFGFSLSTVKGDFQKNLEQRLREMQENQEKAKKAADSAAAETPSFGKKFVANLGGVDALTKQIASQTEALTSSLTQSIGTAITDGILEGKKAMETLADVGAQLFRNFTNDAMANLQKGLTAAIKTVAGSDEVAGAFSGLFSALLGIAGGVISILQRKRSSSKSFNPVTGKIESTQPLRGIVAGPSSVAIEAVGQDLQRALLPTNDILRSIHSTLLAIAGKKGGGGFSGFGFAGSVATT